MGKTQSELVGLKEANRALKALPEFARDEAQTTFDATAFHFSRMAAAAAPRKTGQLADDIEWESRPRSLSAIVAIRKNSYYWKFQEYGTRRHGAHPFLRPTAVRLRSDHHSRLMQSLERARARMAANGSTGGSRVL